MFYINDELEPDKRFDPVKFMNFNDDNFDVLDSYFLHNLKNLPQLGTRQITNEVARPDLLSYKIYGDTQYWWILLKYNNILDINDLVTGTSISYPSKTALEYLYERANLLKKTI